MIQTASAELQSGKPVTGFFALFFCHYNVCKNCSRAWYCTGESFAAASTSWIWLSFRRMVPLLSSRKNCDKVIPKASQSFDKEGIDGRISLRYHEEIVDCVSPDFSESWYSLQ